MLPLIPQDKANHFIYGSVIAVLAGLVANQLGLPVAICSIGAAVAFGLAKEVFDLYQNWKAQKAGLVPTHGVELADFAATAIGGAVVNVLLVSYKGGLL